MYHCIKQRGQRPRLVVPFVLISFGESGQSAEKVRKIQARHGSGEESPNSRGSCFPFSRNCSIVNRNTTIETGIVSATLQRGKPSPLRLGLLVLVGRDVVTFSGLKRPS